MVAKLPRANVFSVNELCVEEQVLKNYELRSELIIRKAVILSDKPCSGVHCHVENNLIMLLALDSLIDASEILWWPFFDREFRFFGQFYKGFFYVL